MELATKGFIFYGKRSFLKRRFETKGFTINAMAVDEYGNLHDPFGGRKIYLIKR